jgi:hypothetical protein
MSKAINATCLGVLASGATFAIYFLTVAAQEPKASERTGDDKPSFIVGTWDAEARHVVMGSLFQQVHGTRLRNSLVHFKQDGDRLTGYVLAPDDKDERWKANRTDFRSVKFAKGQLVFEFDIDELDHGWREQTKSKGWIRVEAGLKGDRLIGKWGVFEKKSGAELFRGEWEAVRTKEPEKK